MSFLEDIFVQIEKAGNRSVLEEIRDGKITPVAGHELLAMVAQARAFLTSRGLRKGDRCALLAHNGICWVAMDLAMMAENLIVVPLYSRHAPADLVAIMKDCSPSLICCGDSSLRDGIRQNWPGAPDQYLFEQIFAGSTTVASKTQIADSDPVSIIYTSGTSGEAKGVVLTAGNIGHVLTCASCRFDVLMKETQRQERVFHYLPFSFASSRVMLLTCLLRGSLLTLNTDLARVASDMRVALADYFVNVPAILERMRKAVDEQLRKTHGVALTIYSRAKTAWTRKLCGESRISDAIWLALANSIVFPRIRKEIFGVNLKALICGSAPLNIETQQFFIMLGIPVMQVYGLTEAICTMDDPHHVQPGRVGPVISGVEMKLAEGDEIIVRGPNVFVGYWNRPHETAKALRDGWFHTGDRGEVNETGNWRIIGRLKNLIILSSGHNIAPEPIEDKLLQQVSDAQQVILIGNNRGYLSAIVTGNVNAETVQAALDKVNSQLPHYKQVRAFHIHPQPFSVDNGLLTANGKPRRDMISARLQAEIEALYEDRTKLR